MFRFIFVLVASIALASGASTSCKVDANLQNSLKTNGVASIVVSFTRNTDQILQKVSTSNYASRGARILSLKTELEEFRDSSQERALHLLKNRGVQYQSMWINNKIYISNANAALVSALNALPEVAEIREEIIAHIGEFTPQPVVRVNSSIYAEWAIEKIEAHLAWVLPGGNNGLGTVVANIDTGVRFTHEAIRNNYRDSYGWFDPSDGTSEPFDTNGHGSHIMGSLVGSNGIGVAPGAQWIACRGCATAACSELHLVACGQWITCPTLPNGDSPDCSKAPSIVSNSWGGGRGTTWYDTVIDAWRVAGIVPFFSVGNSGPSCGTVNSPGDSPKVIGVSCTTATDGICIFSSRGPSAFGELKPDISAPGADIVSAYHTSDDAYVSLSGTSMPPPLPAGTAALLFGYNPNMSYDQVRQLLLENADRDLEIPADTCDDSEPGTFPNNVYGYGRVNARRALEAAINTV